MLVSAICALCLSIEFLVDRKTQGTDGFNPTVALPWDTPLPVASSTSTASLVLPSTVINVPDSDSDEDLTGYVSHSI